MSTYYLENIDKERVSDAAKRLGVKVTFPSDDQFRPHGETQAVQRFLVSLMIISKPA